MLVLYVGIKSLQLAQFKKVCRKQSERLQKQPCQQNTHCNNIIERNVSDPVFILMEGVVEQMGN